MKRLLLAAVLGVACGSTSKSSSSTTPTPASDVTADGRFTKELVYEGECMPAGSRGGCHTVTLRPDGTFTNFLFDAAIQGTYTVEGSGTKLDALTLKP